MCDGIMQNKGTDEQKKYRYDEINATMCYDRKSMGSVSLSARGELGGGLALMRLRTAWGRPLRSFG